MKLKFFILISLFANCKLMFSQSAGSSGSNYVISGYSNSSATGGNITVGGTIYSGYYLGGDITLTAGTGFANGNITLNAPTIQNGKGYIILNGQTSLSKATTNYLAINTAIRTEYRLAVLGNVGIKGVVDAQEVNVKTSVWADYVFKPGYKLLSISELEKYIKKYNHLPNIPTSSKAIEKGINISEMNVKLLEKIEEQALYIIELNRKIEALGLKIEQRENEN